MFFRKKSLSAQMFAVLCICSMPSFSIHAQSQPVSKVGVAIVSGLTLSSLLATTWGGYATYNNFKKWRASVKGFENSHVMLKKIGAIIREWKKVTALGNIENHESFIKITCDKPLTTDERALYEEHSHLLLDHFKKKETARNAMVGASAFTSVMALISSAFIKTILDNTLP